MVEVVVWLAEHCRFSDQKRARLPLPPPYIGPTHLLLTGPIDKSKPMFWYLSKFFCFFFLHVLCLFATLWVMTDLPPVLYVHVYILAWPEAPYLLPFLRLSNFIRCLVDMAYF